MEKKLKKYYQGKADGEISELKKLVPLVIEMNSILKKVNAPSIREFEKALNDKSGFVSASLSAEAYGLSPEYKRLLTLESEIKGRLSLPDIEKGELTPKFIESIKSKYREYYTPEELKVVEKLNKVIASFNNLELSEREHIGINRDGVMQFHPLSPLRNA